MVDVLEPPPADPDLQATVTDFADYTEYFPSDLFRSLTLIRKLDEEYRDNTDKLHSLTRTYGALPSQLSEQRPNPQDLRKDISSSLDRALRSRESSYAEINRLCNLTDNLSHRLTSIRTKLENQPRPPSREHTPPPSVRSKRNESDRAPRIKLVHNEEPRKQASRAGRLSTRRVIVPGEVLPPRDPNSPSPSAASDSEQERVSSPIARPTPKILKLDKEKTPRPPRPPRPEKEKTPKPPKTPKPRAPGTVGSNAHSQKAGISVANAMKQLTPPPDNPQLGSKWAPWLKLSEWELLGIRRRMKKNADWTPSEVMIVNELERQGRGKKAYDEARKRAEETGEGVLDQQPDRIDRSAIHRLKSTDPPLVPEVVDGDVVSKEPDEEGGERVIKLIKDPKPNNELEGQLDSTNCVDDAITVQSKAITNVDKKRKRESRSDDAPPMKKITLKPPGPSAPPVPLIRNDSEPAPGDPDIAVPGEDDVIVENPKHPRKRRSRSGQRSTATTTPTTSALDLNAQAEAPPSTSRPRSRGFNATIKLKLNKKAASAEPEKPRISLRRKSDTDVADKKSSASNARTLHLNTETAASRRGKRAAPGAITSPLAEKKSSVVTLARGKNLPKKKRPAIEAEAEEAPIATKKEPTEHIQSDEERYCICNGPYVGKMVACENGACEIEWFHLGCVGLAELAEKKRLARTSWYCPRCRVNFDCDQVTGLTGD